jgi:hypothetical protein
LRLPWRDENVTVARLDVSLPFHPPPGVPFCGIPNKRLVDVPWLGVANVPQELAVARACTRAGLGQSWWSDWKNPRFGISVDKQRSPFPLAVEDHLSALRDAAEHLARQCDEREPSSGISWRKDRGKRGGQWDVVIAGGSNGLLMAECKGKDRMRDMQRAWIEAAISLGYDVGDFLIVWIKPGQ